MIAAVGLLLGGGLVLVLAPFLWPRVAAAGTARQRHANVLRSSLAQAGLPFVSPTAFLAICALAGIVAAAFTQALVGVVALAAAAAVVGSSLPWLLVRWRRLVRRRESRTVWPDVVDHLVSAVRSGLALPDSVSALAHVGPAATRAAFTEFERDYRATGNFASCLDRLKDALADPVADRILETLRMAREVGGSELTTVLRGLAANLREEAAIRAEVEARQSWVVNAARLGVAAPWIVLVLLASRSEAALAYNTPTGTAVIVCGLALSVVAYRLMIALGRLPEEKRWFR
ncbi:type II secretion system F family protein [Rathayibacter soli]|uniref:type II secretion system F family protein n=1 Tax=Rathayibacter soli TaxID=3144168 RepID=UPI0027E4F6F6|nr:type II secretion system F family protein [Glaciibacter superstes]